MSSRDLGLAGIQEAIRHHSKPLFAESWLSQPRPSSGVLTPQILAQAANICQNIVPLSSIQAHVDALHFQLHCPGRDSHPGNDLPPCEAIRLCGTLAQGKRILT